MKGSVICHKMSGFRPTPRPWAEITFLEAERYISNLSTYGGLLSRKKKCKWFLSIDRHCVCHKREDLIQKEFL